jgi:hypothetical protein
MSSEIILAMSTTISSTGQNSYLAGKIFTGFCADFERLVGRLALLIVEAATSDDFRLFKPGESGCNVGFEGEDGAIVRVEVLDDCGSCKDSFSAGAG